MQDKCVAIIYNEKGKCRYVGEVRNVDLAKLNALRNDINECEQNEFLEKKELVDRVELLEKEANKFLYKEILLSKALYDNFVDRGFIDNDNEFQQMWYDYLLNDKELDLNKAPIEYEKILQKVSCGKYEK